MASGMLKFLDGDKFPDGQRQMLSEEQLGQCFWLLTGFPPHLKLRDLRAGTRGELCPSCKHQSSLKTMEVCIDDWVRFLPLFLKHVHQSIVANQIVDSLDIGWIMKYDGVSCLCQIRV